MTCIKLLSYAFIAPQISVMCLYSEGARKYKAGITPEQMETYLATQYAITNEAAINSDVDLQFSLVHVGPVSASSSRSCKTVVLHFVPPVSKFGRSCRDFPSTFVPV